MPEVRLLVTRMTTTTAISTYATPTIALAAIATLMRQVAVWLFLPATVGVLTSGLPARKLVRDASILALGLLPLLALLVAWGGLLPREIGPPAHLPRI